MNAEYFADDNNEENQEDELKSAGAHEDSDDEEGVQGPPPPDEFKRLLEEWTRDFEKMEAADYQKPVVTPEGSTEVEAQRMKLLRQRQSLRKILWMPSTNLWQTPET